MCSQLTNPPAPPYYAVIFSAQRNPEDDGYAAMAARMLELAAMQPGFLGAESARDSDGFGITVSYWSDAASIRLWKRNTEHLQAQQQGRDSWYRHYRIRIARVEREYAFDSGP